MARVTILMLVLVGALAPAQGTQEDRRIQDVLDGKFQWRTGGLVLSVNPDKLPPSPDNPWHAVKDPSVVRSGDRWHLFCTLRQQRGADGKPPGYIRVGYLSFADWRDAPDATWHLLDLSLDYHGAPQVFYFTPQKKWYLVYQLADKTRGIPYGPCFSTTDDIGKPDSWTAPTPFYQEKPSHVPGWLDFWVICDEGKAHLFFTSLNGQLWRAETKLGEFPKGFGPPEVALKGNFFEAGHTYRLRGLDKYLTLIEAQGQSGGRGRRYYQGYIADRLDGPWQALAARPDRPFAGGANVTFTGPRWTDSFSHGELIRAGCDEKLEVDPAGLQFLYQGLADADYGTGRWRLGLLEPVPE